MTIDDQRIFVCEKLFGWKPPEPNQIVEGYSFQDWVDDLPPLTLDWLHECVKVLREKHPTLAGKYYSTLSQITLHISPAIMLDRVEATAEQRLAALVETLKQSPPVSRAEQS